MRPRTVHTDCSTGGAAQRAAGRIISGGEMGEATDQELARAFQLFDENGDGEITHEEMCSLVCRSVLTAGPVLQAGCRIGGNLTEGEAMALIRQADRDNNGIIDRAEFRELWAAMRGSGEEELRTEFARHQRHWQCSGGLKTSEQLLGMCVCKL